MSGTIHHFFYRNEALLLGSLGGGRRPPQRHAPRKYWGGQSRNDIIETLSPFRTGQDKQGQIRDKTGLEQNLKRIHS